MISSPSGLSSSRPQPGQHPPQPGDSPGPRETNPPRNSQQQRTPAHAEHQRWLPVPQNTPAPHGRRETEQGASQKKPKQTNLQTLTHMRKCDTLSRLVIWLDVQALDFCLVGVSVLILSSVSSPARRPYCSRQLTTSSPWSRRRHSCWHRTTSSNASSR